jgi:hypothetical protein
MPSGVCGFLMNKNFGGLNNAGVGYDYMQNYIGIIDFDKKTLNGSGNSVTNYQQSTAKISNETLPTIPLFLNSSSFSGSYRYKVRR